MTEEEKWDFINQLDEELLIGGVILSGWSCFIAREAETAFVKGANLASILTAVSGIETHLRTEYAQNNRERLATLINNAAINPSFRFAQASPV